MDKYRSPRNVGFGYTSNGGGELFINEPILHRNGICLLFDFLKKCSVKRDGIVSRIENQRDFVIVEINRIDQYRNERLLIFYAVGVALP